MLIVGPETSSFVELVVLRGRPRGRCRGHGGAPRARGNHV